jgi:hypothetical protein
MPRLYTALPRSIQDVFNEYGVQIMTPAQPGLFANDLPRDGRVLAPRCHPSGEVVSVHE